jgi:M6 family metalloprotease-like protein
MNTSFRFSKVVGILAILGVILGNAINAAYAQDEKAPQVSGPVAMPPPKGPLPVEGQPWSSSGRFNIVWGDGQDGSTQTIYTFTDDSGQRKRLFIDETLSQSVGGVLWFDRKKVSVAGVWGTSFSAKGAATGATTGAAATGLHVTSMSLAPSPVTGAVSGDVSPAVTGSQPWITIMCKFSDYPAVEPRDLAYFTNMYGITKPGLDHYWRELSYDTANVAGSNAAGWFMLPQPESYYNPSQLQGGTNLNQLAADCTAAADAGGVNFALYQTGGINMMFNTDFDNGWAWGGSASLNLDGVAQDWRTTWEPPWAYANISVIQHEMGHGFRLPHSSTPWGQSADPYQNAWDVMSQDRYNCAAATDPTYGCYAQHTISYHKDILGWIPALQKVTVPVGTSTITLEQLGHTLPATAGLKMAQIPIGGSSTYFYTVEARLLTGYDAKLPGAAVIIHEVSTARNEPAWIVDTNGAPSSDASAMWVVGETYTDAVNNISVRVDSATATGFVVTISNNSAPIVDTPLSNGVALNQTMTAPVQQGTTKYYYVDLPAGSSNLVVDLYNLTGDLDLYVLQGSKPTFSGYDCVSARVGSNSESCTFPSPSSGRWWIGVTNWDTGGLSYTIKASFDNTVPDQFTFTDQKDVALSTEITSNTIAVSGINAAIPISITGGTYSINSGPYTNATGTVSNGNTVTVRQTSSGSYSTTTNATLTIGWVSDTFSVTTLDDTVPDQFTFTNQTGVALSTVITSNTITVSGINAATPISVTGGTYSINSGLYTNATGTVSNGNTVTVRQTSSGSYSTTTNATLTIGGVSDTFSVTTLQTEITDCSGDVVLLQNVTFTAGNAYNCTATTSITAGTGVTVQSGATVNFRAPKINLQPGFKVESGAAFSAKQ